MAINTFYPRSREDSENLIKADFTDFSGGMTPDLVDVELPSNETYLLNNVRGHTDSLQGRYGSVLWADTELPFIREVVAEVTVYESRLSVAATTLVGFKTGMTLRVSDDEGTTSFLILGSITDNEVGTVHSCKITGKNNIVPDKTYTSIKLQSNIVGNFYDEKTDAEYIVMGDIPYRYKNETFTELYTEVPFVSSTTTIARVDEHIVFINAGGIFAFKAIDEYCGGFLTLMNADGTDNLLEVMNPNEYLNDVYAYDYNYTYITQNGNLNEDRNGLEVENYMLQETTPFDKNSTIYTYAEISERKFLKLTGNESPVASEWRELSDNNLRPYVNIVMGTDIDDPEVNEFLFFDFSDIITLEDVAGVFNESFKVFDNKMSVEWHDGMILYLDTEDDEYVLIGTADAPYDPPSIDNPGYEIDVPPYNLGTQTVERPVGNSSCQFWINSYDVAKPDTITKFTGHPIGELIPPMWVKPTNYGVYRTKNIYAHKKPTSAYYDASTQNSPLVLGWVYDIPLISFTGVGMISPTRLKIDSGFVNHTSLAFNETGLTVVYDDYTTEEIESLSSGEVDDLIVLKTTTMAGTNPICLIRGTDEILKFTIDDTIGINGVSYDEISFTTLDDVARVVDHVDRVFFEGGETRIIFTDIKLGGGKTLIHHIDPTYDDEGVLIVNQFASVSPVAFTANDRIDDVELGGTMYAWTLDTQLYKPLPNTSVGAYVSGVLMLTDLGSSNILNYSIIADFRLLGYYNKAFQRMTGIGSPIRAVAGASDVIVIFTANSTYIINPAQGYIDTNESLGTSFAVMPEPELVDNNIGTYSMHTIVDGIDGGLVVLTTSHSVRTFQGSEYSEDYGYGKVSKSILSNIDHDAFIFYTPALGLYLWGGGSSFE